MADEDIRPAKQKRKPKRDFGDLTGRTFADLRVIEKLPQKNTSPTRYKCVCICGTERSAVAGELVDGVTVSCGCHVRRKLIGKRYGKLYVESFSHSNNGVFWNCVCDCGNKSVAATRNLESGEYKSCGCGSREAAMRNLEASWEKSTTHGLSHTRIDHCYKNIKRRCYDQKNKRWESYGARGIKMCAEWLADPQKFFDWAFANGYTESLTIDRINVDGDYSPENCRWADAKTQMRNMTRNVFLEWNGERRCMSEWAEVLGVKTNAVQHRVERGWSVERIFTQPFRKSSPRKKRD